MSATQLRAPALRRVERTRMTPHVDTLAVSIGESSLGQVLVAQSASGVVAVLLGDDRDALRGELATRFPGAEFVDPDAQAATVAARLVKIVDGPGNAADIARIPLDPRGTDVSAHGVARTLYHSRRRDGDVFGNRETHRSAKRGTRGRARVRHEPDCRARPLPSRRAERRQSRGLPLGRRSQARAARTRGSRAREQYVTFSRVLSQRGRAIEFVNGFVEPVELGEEIAAYARQ